MNKLFLNKTLHLNTVQFTSSHPKNFISICVSQKDESAITFKLNFRNKLSIYICANNEVICIKTIVASRVIRFC